MRNCEKAKELSLNEMYVGLHALHQLKDKLYFDNGIDGYRTLYLQDALYLVKGKDGAMYLERGTNPIDAIRKVEQKREKAAVNEEKGSSAV